MKILIVFPLLVAGIAGAALAQASPTAAPAAAAPVAAPAAAQAPQMARDTPVVQNAVTAPTEYKACSKDVTDECVNTPRVGHKKGAHKHRRSALHA